MDRLLWQKKTQFNKIRVIYIVKQILYKISSITFGLHAYYRHTERTQEEIKEIVGSNCRAS